MSYEGAHEWSRRYSERVDRDLPELVLMLLESIRESQVAAREVDESSHPRRDLVSVADTNPCLASMGGDKSVPRDAVNVRGTGQPHYPEST